MSRFIINLCVCVAAAATNLSTGLVSAQKVDYSVVYVPEESNAEITKITTENDYVCLPPVKRSSRKIAWLTNRILSVSPDGNSIAYLSLRNGLTNIYIKDLNNQSGASRQRTNRTAVIDFAYSPDGSQICFTESNGNSNQIFLTDAAKGYVCKQVTADKQDYAPIYSADMKSLFFSRIDDYGSSIWSFNTEDRSIVNYTSGMNPYPASNESTLYVARPNSDGKGEIWRINLETGEEECILSDPEHSFFSPMLSPSGDTLLIVGSTKISKDKKLYDDIYQERISYWNTDIYTCNTDGTGLSQQTFHAADDLSPVWSADGDYIYFISQRGNPDGIANIWKIKFRP